MEAKGRLGGQCRVRSSEQGGDPDVKGEMGGAAEMIQTHPEAAGKRGECTPSRNVARKEEATADF